MSQVRTISQGREKLGQALAALQADAHIPPDVMAVTQHIAQAVGSLFDAEKNPQEPAIKQHVRQALGYLSQTLALLQDVRAQHQGISVATAAIATVMSELYPLSGPRTSQMPPAPSSLKPGASSASKASPSTARPRKPVEVNVGATTESNFYVGFSGEISEGGVFVATYSALAQGTPVEAQVTLPGGFEMRIKAHVNFVRDPADLGNDSEPGMGLRFEHLSAEERELILRFVRKRAPMFYDE